MNSIHIRFGGYQVPASVHSRAAVVLGQALEARLGDAVSFEIEGNIVAQGRKAAELLEMVDSGELTMGYFSTSYLAERVPEFAVLDLPFMVTDREAVHAALDGALGALFTEKLLACSNYRALGYWDNGFRHFSNRVRAIRRPEDCKGLKIRNLFSKLHVRTFELLGFDAVTLDVRDLVPAVQSGEVDAQDNPLTNINNFKIQDYHRWITLTGHFFGSAALLCHKPSYDAWPAEVRAAVEEAAREATVAQRGFASGADAEVMALLDPAQNEIIHLNGEERAAFVAAVAPLVEEQVERFGAELLGYLAGEAP